MAGARVQIRPGLFLFYCLSSAVALIAFVLTLVLEWSHDEGMIPLLFPLFPGVLAGLLITGGHGGTANQERVAAYIAAAVNALSYAFIIWCLRAAWRACSADLKKQ